MGCYSIGFSGGEPFCRKDFLDILAEAKLRGFRISFITNGQLINEDDINRLYEIGVDRITVSFHSLSKKNYNEHFGINNNLSYNKALKAIKKMKEIGLSVGIAVTVTKYNIEEIYDIKNYFNQIGINENDINFNSLLTGAKNIEKLRPTEEQLRKFNYRKKISSGFLCSAGRISCSISWDGLVYPCTFFNNSIGSILDDSIKNIWENSHFIKILRSINEDNFKKCKNCSIRDKCNVCLVTNINETNNIFEASEAYCRNKNGLIYEIK